MITFISMAVAAAGTAIQAFTSGAVLGATLYTAARTGKVKKKR